MKVFAHATVFETDIVIKIKTNTGKLLHVFSCRSFKKAPEFAKNWGEKNGYDIEWKPNIMNDADQLSYEHAYLEEYGIRTNGTEPKHSFPW